MVFRSCDFGGQKSWRLVNSRQLFVELFNEAGGGEIYSVGSDMQSFLDCVTKYYSLFYDYPDTIKKVWFSGRTETEVTEVMVKEEDLIRPILEKIVYQTDDGTVYCDDKDVDWNDVKQQVSQL